MVYSFIIAISLLLFTPTNIMGRDLDNKYSQVDPQTRKWFQEQKSPKDGQLCCSIADGTYAEEDIVSGHYWTRWRMPGDILTPWQPVPDDVVIHEPNRNGSAVVWYTPRQDGSFIIRCFSPGGGV